MVDHWWWLRQSDDSNCCRWFTISYNYTIVQLYDSTIFLEPVYSLLSFFRMINNGVYRAGFATKQEAYDTAVREVFSGLARVEDILSKTRYLAGDRFTEADIRLFVTLIRFDSVYVLHFKCNKKRIVGKHIMNR